MDAHRFQQNRPVPTPLSIHTNNTSRERLGAPAEVTARANRHRYDGMLSIAVALTQRWLEWLELISKERVTVPAALCLRSDSPASYHGAIQSAGPSFLGGNSRAVDAWVPQLPPPRGAGLPSLPPPAALARGPQTRRHPGTSPARRRSFPRVSLPR